MMTRMFGFLPGVWACAGVETSPIAATIASNEQIFLRLPIFILLYGYAPITSGLERPALELLASGPEVTEVVHRRSRRRERERLELLLEHLLQVVLGGDADRHVW